MKLRSELDLTQGKLFTKIFKFVFPLMMTTIFQLLYTTIDLWTVSEFGGGPLSMTAIGSNSALIHLLISMLIALSTGSSVTISIAKGAGDREKADRILHTSLVIAVVGGVIFGIFGYFVAPYMLKLMDTPESYIDKSIDYLKIYFIGMPFLATFNFGSQMLRSLGDSKRPLMFLIIAGCINVLLDLLFVIVFKMDVKGVALATIISQAVSALLVILWFYKNPKNGFVQLDFKKLKISKQEFKEILKIGIPAGIQSVAFCIPNVFIQSSLYTITDCSINGILISKDEVASGAAASAQLEGYIFAMLDSFCIGVIAEVGQNYGAKKPLNIKKCYWFSLIWIGIFSVFSSLVILFFYEPLLSIFLTDTEDIVVSNAILAGRERLFLLGFTYFLDGWMDLNACYLKGLKYSTPAAIITIIGCTGFRILFLLTLFQVPEFHTIFWLYAAFPLSWILVNFAYLPTCLIYKKKAMKLIYKK